VDALIAFWSHALAAALFAALTIWRLGYAARQPGQRLLAGALAVTACSAWLTAVTPGDAIVGYAESARNLLWIRHPLSSRVAKANKGAVSATATPRHSNSRCAVSDPR
jgi:hypothetical protein